MSRLRSRMLMMEPVSAASTLLTNLISYWKLNEASGNRVDSVVATANDLAPLNTPGNAAGKVGNALSLVGASLQAVGLASNASLQTGDIDFTIAGWVKLGTETGYPHIISKWGNGTDGEYLIYNESGVGLAFSVRNTAGSAGASAINPAIASTGVWYFFCAWHDATANTINIQIDNGTVTSTAHSGGVRAAALKFHIGIRAAEDAQSLDGFADEVGFWKRVLTADERTQIYNSGNGVTYPAFA